MRHLLFRPTAFSVSVEVRPLAFHPLLTLQRDHGSRRFAGLACYPPLRISLYGRSASSIHPQNAATVFCQIRAQSSTDAAHLDLDLDLFRSHYGLQKSGTENFDEILYQADVTGETLQYDRLVDQPQYRKDFRLWVTLLRTRLRLHGLAGVWDIWKGLRLRRIDLPTVGEEADQIWPAIVSAAIQHEALKEVWLYIQKLYKRSGRRYELLYVQIIGFFVRQDREPSALMWHRRFRSIDLPVEGSLSRLVDEAVRSPGRLRILAALYDDSNDRTLYDKMITTLCEQGNYREAMVWHDRLISKNDMPSSATIADPLRRHLALSGETEKLRHLTSTLVSSGVSFAGSIPKALKQNTKISRVIMSKLLGEIHGVKPKIISDEFCARSFATRAFPVELVIRGLTAFGVENIGPLALREMVLRCSTTKEIKDHYATFRTLGVKIQECTYTDLIHRLVYENKADMLKSMVASDMHPDVYDDGRVQKQILGSAINSQDWAQVHRSLTILTASDAHQRTHAWNILLRGYMDARDWEKITAVHNDMMVLQILMEPTTIRNSFFSLLRPRNAGKRPVSLSHHFDDLSFLVRLWLQSLRCGGDIPAQAWRQVHTYFGMEGRFVELEKLSVWLAMHYSRKTEPGALVREQSVVDEDALLGPNPKQELRPSLRLARFLDDTDKGTPLRTIFTVQRQSAIVAWGFKTVTQHVRGDQQCKHQQPGRLESAYQEYLSQGEPAFQRFPHWARGVALLMELRSHGVPVHAATVRKACRQRLIIMFGKGRSSRKENREMQSTDMALLRQMVLFLNVLWGPGLFPHGGYTEVEREGFDSRAAMGDQMFEHLLGLHVRKAGWPIRVRRFTPLGSPTRKAFARDEVMIRKYIPRRREGVKTNISV